ncbi:MAG: cytochrome c [Leptospiraceae bacterium]|nr:cytochrome c [Leptospiraceae bacterium]
MKNKLSIILILLFSISYCGKPNNEEKSKEENKPNLGIGPIQSVTLGELDPQKAKKGKEIFDIKCASCHKMEEKYVGPALKGVTSRRTPEWILNMILNPEEMVEKDPVANELLQTYMAKMVGQGLTEDEAKNVLEYFRETDSK